MSAPTHKPNIATPKRKIFATTHPFFEGGDILGRTVANTGFITALLQADPFDEYHFFLANQNQIEVLKAFFHGATAPQLPTQLYEKKIKLRLRHALPEAVKTCRYHCFHLSDSISDAPAICALRNAVAPEIFPVTGVTHSLSYARYLPHFFAQLWPGRTERDAIVVTSTAGVQALSNIFKLLLSRFSLKTEEGTDPALGMSVPRMERIPLGVNLDEFFAPDDERKQTLGFSCRQSLGLSENDRVGLVFGRFSHHSKMDLLPLLRAVQRAVTLGLDAKNFVLILAGAMQQNDAVPGMLQALAKNIGLRLILKPSPSATEKQELYAAADIFISPSDNIQETFGITIIEAGAAGLPVLASDYDGYKDLVRHGETGFLIPTIGPAQSRGSDVLSGVLFENHYHLHLAQQTVIDVPSFADYLIRLVNDPELCRRMGRAGRRNVEDNYSWSRVIQHYVDCWEKLWSSPISSSEREKLRGLTHPFAPNFAQSFAGYTTRLLSPELRVRWSKTGEAVYHKKDFPVIYGEIEHMLDLDLLRRLLFQARSGCTAGELMDLHRQALLVLSQSGDSLDVLNEENAAFVVLWALKNDLLELA